MLINNINYIVAFIRLYIKNLALIIITLNLISCTSTVRFSSSIANNNNSSIEKKINSNAPLEEPKQNYNKKFRGYASYYSDKFQGQRTSSGEIYDKDKFTAAHPDLPFGTIVEVRNLSNNKTVRVKINDRGPFITGRIIDLSRSAANAIGMVQAGIVEVEITIISIP